MKRWWATALAVLAALGWRVAPPAEVDWGAEPVLERARARPVAERLRSRVTVRAHHQESDRSLPTATGALALERPGRLRLDLNGPMGSPVLILSVVDGDLFVDLSDGQGPRVAERAQQVLTELTDGLAGIDDLVGLVTGDLPLDDAPVLGTVREDADGRWFALDAPAASRLDALVDARTGVPRRVLLRGRQGGVILRIRYGQYAEDTEGHLLPGAMVVELPPLALSAEVDFGDWEPHQLAAKVYALGLR